MLDTRNDQPEPRQRASSPTLITAAVLALAAVTVAAVWFSVRSQPPPELPSAAVTVVTPKPKAAKPAARVASPECPQLTNPGGRMKWQPSPNAGPWPTDGSVTLPSLGVEAPIVRVGVDSAAHMVVPGNAKDVAWLDQGEIPLGPTQNVVLAGHINYSRVRGSFSRIQSLQPGDSVFVKMGDKQWEYRVQWGCLFDRNTTQAERIMGYTETPSVTLISCGGVFDRAAGTHNKRVAVRAELVSDV
ncbi:MAG: class F sortase [Actinomycetota bacterium]